MTCILYYIIQLSNIKTLLSERPKTFNHPHKKQRIYTKQNNSFFSIFFIDLEENEKDIAREKTDTTCQGCLMKLKLYNKNIKKVK